MDIFPSNLPGTLISKVLDIGPAAPEKDVVRRIIEKSLCIKATTEQAAMSGYFRMSENYLQDILCVLPNYLVIDTPIWIEHSAYDVARYLDCELWTDGILSSEAGYCFFTPEDKPNKVGIIFVTSHGDSNPSENSFVKDGISILPYVAYIDSHELYQSTRAIMPTRLDLMMKRLHRNGVLSSLSEVETMLMDCVEVSEISGIIRDAAFLNGWNGKEKQTYCESAIKGAMHATFRAVSLLIAVQTKGIEHGLPGYFSYKKHGSWKELVWKKSLLGKKRELQYPIMTPDVSGQVSL